MQLDRQLALFPAAMECPDCIIVYQAMSMLRVLCSYMNTHKWLNTKLQNWKQYIDIVLLKHPELLQILSPWTVDRLIRPIRKSEGH